MADQEDISDLISTAPPPAPAPGAPAPEDVSDLTGGPAPVRTAPAVMDAPEFGSQAVVDALPPNPDVGWWSPSSKLVEAVTGWNPLAERAFAPEALSVWVGALTTDDPKALARVYEKNVPGVTVIQTDEGPQIDFEGERYWVNKPGLSETDIMGIAPFLAGGAVRGTTWIGRALQTGLIESAIQGGREVGSAMLGADPEVADALTRMGFAGAGGAVGSTVGEVAQVGIDRLVNAIGGRKIFGRDGRVTQTARAAFRRLGYDIDNFTPDQLRHIDEAFGNLGASARRKFMRGDGAARTNVRNRLLSPYRRRAAEAIDRAEEFVSAQARQQADADAAAQSIIAQQGVDEFGVPLTRGQATGDPNLLRAEESVQFGPTLAPFRQAQTEALGETAEGLTGTGTRGDIAGQVGQTVEAAGQAARTGVQQAYDVAGAAGGRAWMTPPADRALALRARLEKREFADLTKSLAPLAHRTYRDMLRMADSIAEAGEMRLDRVMSLRKTINRRWGDLGRGTDRTALSRLKREFDAWVDDALLQGMIAGDQAAVSAFRSATDASRRFKELFDGPTGQDVIRRMVDGSISEIETARFLFGTGRELPGGRRVVLDVIDRLETIGGEAMRQRLRQGAWSTILRKPNSDLKTPSEIVSSIKQTLDSNSELARRIFTPDERRAMRRLQYQAARMTRASARRSSGTAERFWESVREQIPILGEAINQSRAASAVRPYVPVETTRGLPAATGALGAPGALEVEREGLLDETSP